MNGRERGNVGCAVPFLISLAGLFFLGPLGFFLGPLASIFFSRPQSRGGMYGYGELSATQDSLLVLLAAVIRADGRIMRSELDFVRILFLRSFGEKLARVALLRLRDLLKQDLNIMTASRILRVSMTEQARVALVRILMDLAQADGTVSNEERTVIKQIAFALGVSIGNEQQENSRRRTYAHTPPPTDYYAVLGLEPSASNEEIKQAYRRLAIKWHPDRMGDKSAEERKKANEMLQRINEAYEKIKLSRGIK